MTEDVIAGIEVEGNLVLVRAGDLELHLDLSRGGRVTAVRSAALPDADLVERWWCGYSADGERWSDAPAAGERAFATGAVRVRSGKHEVVAHVSTPHLRVEKRFTVYPGLPFIRIRYRTETSGVEAHGPGLSLGLPAIQFTHQLVDPFDLHVDTADDGAELDGGLALPAWRIFANAAHSDGLFVFAAERATMSRLQVIPRGCAFRPAYYLAYSTEVLTTRELRLGLQYANFGPLDELDWFLGAYRSDDLPRRRRLVNGFHARRRLASSGTIVEVSREAGVWSLPPLAALPRPWPAQVTVAPGQSVTRTYLVPAKTTASLTPLGEGDEAGVHVTAQAEPWPGESAWHTLTATISAGAAALPAAHEVALPLPGDPPGEDTLPVTVDVVQPVPLPAGEDETVIGAEALATVAGAGWHLIRRPELPGGCALIVHAGKSAPPLRIDPGLSGTHDVYAGFAHGVGIKLRLDGDPYWTYISTNPLRDVQNWDSLAAVCRPGPEALLHNVVLDGRGLEIAPHPNLNGHTALTHLRFVPAPPAPSLLPGKPAVGGDDDRRFFAGLADTPDVSYDLAADSFVEGPWREAIWQHAEHGFDTVYWRIDGQCADFHTKIGTVRYPLPRTHSLYSPISRYYGQALQRLDPLRIAVDESRRWSVRLFGWMRTNNYSGNVVAEFFTEHPEWHDEGEDGSPAPALCFAFPEVRAHKIAILCEAAAYGLDGLLIDTLRHPPMVHYAPVVVNAFRAESGEDPPREPQSTLSRQRVDNRAGERWERWFRFRARYFTTFIRELRETLVAAGMGTLPVHLRVAPRRYLHDGADLDALLEERLIDAVVANRYTVEPLDYDLLVPVIRGRVPLCAICDPLREDAIDSLSEMARDRRLQGIGVYESEWSIHMPEHRPHLRQAAHLLRG